MSAELPRRTDEPLSEATEPPGGPGAQSEPRDSGGLGPASPEASESVGAAGAPPQLDQMLELARRALANAHAPYSRFPVGACLRAGSGRLYAGCNVENASYPVGQCAEATAVGAMVAAGDREIVEVVLLSVGRELCSPCGRCRQQLAEFARADARIHLCGPEGIRVTTTLGQLLPLAFGHDTLGFLG